jgi:predicted metal-dependent phosphoesterase TrpH
MAVDLHTHTTASDGTASPADVVAFALERRLSVIAITDHDSVEGIDEALVAADGTSLTVIPGVELSASTEDALDLHILGFFLDHRSPALLSALAGLRARRLDRAKEMVDALTAAGYAVTLERVFAQAGSGSVGRSHIARALVDAGDVESVEHAFRDLIGRSGPFFIGKRLLSAVDAVALIRAAGGVAVLAHPGVTRSDASIPELVQAGLGGLEAFHAEHTQSDRDRYAGLAERLGLVVTGGSDYHGPGTKNASLGAGGCPDSAVEALRERAGISRP